MAPIVRAFIKRDIKKLRLQMGDEAFIKYKGQLIKDSISAVINEYTNQEPFIDYEQRYLGYKNWYLQTIQKQLMEAKKAVES